MSRRKKISDDQNDEQGQFWQLAVETWQASDLSVRQFCKQEGLSEPTFYKWRNKLINNVPSHTNESKQSAAFIEVAKLSYNFWDDIHLLSTSDLKFQALGPKKK